MASLYRAIFPVGDCLNPAGDDAADDEVITGRIGTALAEGEVVSFGAALIGIAGDEDFYGRIFGEPSSLAVEGDFRVGAYEEFVENKELTITDILLQILL
jgi:hypothetical protein